MSRILTRLAVAGVLGCGVAPDFVAAQTPDDSGTVRSLVVVLVQQLNIREEPRLGAPVVGASVRGDTLCVVSFQSDWVEVASPDASVEQSILRGFVSRGLVSEVRATPAAIAELGCGSGGRR